MTMAPSHHYLDNYYNVMFIIASTQRHIHLGVEVRGVLVVVPGRRVVAVRQAEAGHPVLPLGVATSLRHETRDKRRWADVELQPLVS